MRRKRILTDGLLSIALAMVLLTSVPDPARADDLAELKTEIRKLQDENTRLQEQLNRQREVIEQLLRRIEAPEQQTKTPAQPQEAAQPKPRGGHDARPPETEGASTLSETLAFVPKLEIRGFTDITFSTERRVNAGRATPSTFSLGQYDLFITSKLTDTVSVLSETVLEFGEDNELVVDQERLELKYAPSDLFSVRIGRMHTPLGYWNHAFHHGAWLQTTAFRPLLYSFEDDGGILPVHSVGIQFFGLWRLQALDLDYTLSVVNGRGRRVTEVQNLQDRNDAKAFTVLLGAAPQFPPGLRFGVNAYLDKIPSDEDTPGRNGEIDELILGGYVVYLNRNLELLAEVSRIHHRDRVSRLSFDTWGLYAQAAYQLGRWKPYYRFDFIDFGNGDPYFVPNDSDTRKHTFGIRYDPFTWLGLKLEYSFSLWGDGETHAVSGQAAFTF